MITMVTTLKIIMAEIKMVLRGLATSNEGDADGL